MKDKTKKVAIGAMVAALAGYVAGILTAPKSGKETRKDIGKAATKARTEAEKRLKSLHSELDKLLAEAKTNVAKTKATVKKEYAEAIGTAQIAKEKAREVLSAIHEGDADDQDLKNAIDEVKKSIDHLKTFLTK